jgi:hypothetical protein
MLGTQHILKLFSQLRAWFVVLEATSLLLEFTIDTSFIIDQSQHAILTIFVKNVVSQYLLY